MAYCVDEAVYLWGSKIDSELDKAGLDPKDLADPKRRAAIRRREAVLNRYLGTPDESAAAPPPGTFRDPASFLGRSKKSSV